MRLLIILSIATILLFGCTGGQNEAQQKTTDDKAKTTEDKKGSANDQTKVIIPSGQNLGWLEAREAVKDKGGLPSNVLHDDVLVRSEAWKQLGVYYPAWAREVLVYPAKGDTFKKGEDVVDVHIDEKGRKWVFPASFIPEEAVGKEKVGLFVDPEDAKVEDYNGEPAVIIYPKSIVVLHGFIQESVVEGRVDEDTRIPLEVAPEVAEKLAEDQKRWLYRRDGAGVEPLVRYAGGALEIVRRGVTADDGHNVALGVGYVSH